MAIITQISKSKLVSGDLLETLRFAFAADQESFKKAFNAYGIGVECDEDLKTLSELHRTGKDLNGSIKDESGNVVVFDVQKILWGYNLNPNSVNRSGVTFTD